MSTLRKLIVAAVAAGAIVALTPDGALAQRSDVEIWAQSCGSCHALQPARRYTANQWESLITHMMITARLTDAEAEAVLRFLRRGARPVATNDAGNEQRDRAVAEVAASDLATTVAILQDSVPNGARLYARECSACHGSRGRGDGRAGRIMDPRPTDITDSTYLAEHSDEDIARDIREGSGEMDPLGDELNTAEIQAIVDFLRRLGALRTR